MYEVCCINIYIYFLHFPLFAGQDFYDLTRALRLRTNPPFRGHVRNRQTPYEEIAPQHTPGEAAHTCPLKTRAVNAPVAVAYSSDLPRFMATVFLVQHRGSGPVSDAYIRR
jgi:hypothetical protein